MADERKIVIEILGSNNSDDDNSSNINKEDAETRKLRKTIDKIFHPLKNTEDKVFSNILLNQSWERVKNLAISGIELTYNRYYTVSEDYVGQNNANNIKSLIGKLAGFAGSVGMSAKIGAKFGTKGAIIGGVIGGVGYIGGEFLSNTGALSSRYQVLNAANINMEFARKRAGLYDDGRGTEN